MIIDGIKIKNEILEEVKKGVSELSFKPIFCDVLVGSDPVSLQYVNLKAKIANYVGIDFHKTQFPENISTLDLCYDIKILGEMDNMCGLIVQLPLPDNVHQKSALDAININIDVDCLNSQSQNTFYNNTAFLSYPTALACMHIIDSLNIDLSGKKIVVLGQGMLVGRPVTHLLSQRGFTVDTITRETLNKEELLLNADLIISAIGQGKYITGDMIKKGVIIIDAGTSEINAGIVGDVDMESVRNVASYVSPVPGGVGPVTVAMLLLNVLKVAQRRALKDGARHDFAKSHE